MRKKNYKEKIIYLQEQVWILVLKCSDKQYISVACKCSSLFEEDIHDQIKIN